jgi:hypothetical protein
VRSRPVRLFIRTSAHLKEIRMSKTYDIAAVVAEIQGDHPDITIKAGSETFTLPAPQLWPDDVLECAETPLLLARKLLGDNYAAFVAAGGSALVLAHILQKEAGVGVGESSAS